MTMTNFINYGKNEITAGKLRVFEQCEKPVVGRHRFFFLLILNGELLHSAEHLNISSLENGALKEKIHSASLLHENETILFA